MAKSGSQTGHMASFLHSYCQLKGTKPAFDFTEDKSRIGGSWKCVLRVPGTNDTTQAAGATKKDAQEAATRAMVVRLQAAGVMIKGSKQKAAAPSGPSWAIGGPTTVIMPPSKRPKAAGPGPPGQQAQTVGRTILPEMQRMQQMIRAGEAVQALEYAEEHLDGCPRAMSVKQLAQLMMAVGVKSKEVDVLAFFDGLTSLEVVAFPNPPASAYFWRFGRWAVREFLAEGKGCESQAGTTAPQILERNGSCMSNMTIAPGRGPDWELILNPTSGELPRGHSFSAGDWIFMTTPHMARVRLHDKGGQPTSFEAEFVSFLPQPQVGIVVKVIGATGAAVKELVGKTCRIDRAANHVTFCRQVNALLVLCTAPGELDWLSLALLAAEEDGGHERVAAFCGHFPPGGGFPSGSPVLRNINQSQYEALQAATSRRVTLIQGPPGSGKTTTAVLLMRLWVTSGRKPVLATADSNIAADNLVAGCAAAGMQVIRVGRKESSRPELQDYNLFEKARASGLQSGPRHGWKGEKKVLGEADVVCCTCSGAEHPAMQDLKFKNVLVDEAGQTTELGTLVPMMHLQADGSVVLVGDHRQLPATVACLEADVEGLGTSLFERLATLAVPPMLLDVQYRMHPAIAAFPSQQYYAGRLRSGVEGSLRRAPKGIQWPVPSCPIAFLPIQSHESKEGNSFTNMVEVNTVLELLSSVLASGDIQPGDVGIITPYAAQARLLRGKLGLDVKSVERGVQRPEVSSIDGFQGREKDLIFISPVRANLVGKVGFSSDPRRLNVMLTRAKRGLVVIGDFATLGADEHGWRPWLQWCQERGLICGCPATNPTAAARLQALSCMPQQQLLLATTPSDMVEETLAQCAAAEAAEIVEAEAAAAEAPVLRPKRKSMLMQIREAESEKAGNGEAA
mmetsp:Transcript_1241/g.3618  ORF Transcript_1241/g.3618 Transcript_1241/m.3618 type:complete len:905 (+) Transcript_1241:95-2809(+)